MAAKRIVKTKTSDGLGVRLKVILKDPRVARAEGLVTPDECAAIIAAARDHLHPSRVVAHGEVVGGARAEAISGRTSWSCRVPRAHPAVLPVLKRLAEIVKIPVSHTEPIQVVHYDVAQEYRPHNDWFDPAGSNYEESMARGGQRLVSCFVYLADCEGGGHTDFPILQMSFPPARGDAMVWYNRDANGNMDGRTLHAGAPVTKGEKWGMNVWFREGPRPEATPKSKP